MGCGIIIEVPQDTTSGGSSDTDTDTGSDNVDTTADPDSGSSTCDQDQCTSGVDSTGGDDTTTDAVPPPGPSHCALPFEPAVGGLAMDSQMLPMTGPMTDVHVQVRVTKHEIDDLEITVEHGDMVLTLVQEPMDGQCLGSHVDAIFDDDAEVPADDSCSMDGSAIVGAVVPHDQLAAFHDMEAGGEWILRVHEQVDPNEPTVTTLESWCVAVSGDEPME